MSRQELLGACDAPEKSLIAALHELVATGQVVEGDLATDRPGPLYRWAARWRAQTRSTTRGALEELREIVPSEQRLPAHQLTLDCPPVKTFHEFVIQRYSPPADKRLLVFLQCSVRRPFSKSASHGSLRRAISTATGHDPARHFAACPVHVVVLASRIGPVPYELEDTYPANVSSGGVKHFSPDHYQEAGPVLSRRMMEYLQAHGDRYDRVAGFGDGRYGEVLRNAGELAGRPFPVFPREGAPHLLRVGASVPRTYWQRCWIQLFLEIVSWLDKPAAQAARRRLEALDAVYE
jgi:uncharacterized protein DUF5591